MTKQVKSKYECRLFLKNISMIHINNNNSSNGDRS